MKLREIQEAELKSIVVHISNSNSKRRVEYRPLRTVETVSVVRTESVVVTRRWTPYPKKK